MDTINMNNDYWTLLTMEESTYPPTGITIFILADSKDEGPFLLQVVMKGSLPHHATFILTNPKEDQDTCLSQKYDVIAWRLA